MIDKTSLKNFLKKLGIEPRRFTTIINRLSIQKALEEQGRNGLVKQLAEIVPDITGQYSRKWEWNEFWEIKVRGLHAFQCSLMVKALETFSPGRITVVDIGDSSGAHMLYLKGIAKNGYEVNSLSVNLDSVAVEKIKARGLQAMLCRAEDLDPKDLKVDLFTSFEMVEHLHDPVRFFRRLAKKSNCERILITVPYVRSSRIGLHYIRNQFRSPISAEGVHILELSPEDWTLLLLHAGWRLTYQQIYYQYPRKWPILNRILGWYWRNLDFEGFWGAILEKDTYWSDFYQDWED